VNAGVYVINRSWALTAWPEGVFSLETDVLLRLHHQSLIMGFLSEGDFLDIGTPESYADATRFVALLDT
jgi:NDP-sugar pyrophosphorylase family protein